VTLIKLWFAMIVERWTESEKWTLLPLDLRLVMDEQPSNDDDDETAWKRKKVAQRSTSER